MCHDCLGECEIVDLIVLSSLTAAPGNRRVTIDWQTASDIDNAGFNIYRSDLEDGEYVNLIK